MDQGPLVTEQIKTGEKLITEFCAYKPIAAAFWAKESDGGTTHADYGEVLRLVGNGHEIGLDPFQVKVIGAGNPVARAVLDWVGKSHNLVPVRYFGRRLGDLSVDEAYIYAVPNVSPV